MKKLISLIIMLSILVTAPVFAQNTQSDEEFTDDILIMNKLGIMVGDESGEFHADECVTRAEFAKIISVLTGWNTNVSPYNSTGFKDLSEDHWGYPYIYYSVSSGYMIGDENGNFRPDDCITGIEAAKVMIHVMGYVYQANEQGGYPFGYEAVALNLGVFDGLYFKRSDYILRGEMARLINNCLDVNIVEFKAIVGNEYKYHISDDKTILTEYFDMKTDKGIVVATDSASVKGYPTQNEGRILINEKSFIYEGDAEELLGKRCRFIYSFDENDDTENRIVSIVPDEIKTLEIERADYLDFIGNKLSYKDDNNNTRSVTVSQSADYIVNGENKIYYQGIFDDIKLGKITLYSTEGSVYDIVKIESAYIMTVGEINSYTEKIIDKNNNLNIIDFSDEFKKYNIITKNGKNGKITDISEDDLLTVIESSSKIDIYISRSSVTGIVDYVSYDDNEISVNNEVLKLNYYFKENFANVTPGREVSVITDNYGFASWLTDEILSESDTGYLVKIGGRETPEDSNLQIKIFKTDGKFLKTGFCDNVRINGNAVKNITKAQLIDKLGLGNNYNCIVKYTLSDNKIKTLETAKTKEELEFSGKDGICKMYPEELRCHMMESDNFGFEIYYNSSTKFMKLPSEPQSADESEFKILDSGAFIGSTNYTVEGYTESIDDVVSSVIITKDSATSSFEGHDVIAVISKITGINDEIKGKGSKISFYAGKYGSSPTEFTLYSYDEDALSDSNGYTHNDFVKGDIIKLMYNSENELTKFETYYKYDESKWLSNEIESKTAVNRIYLRNVSEIKKGFVLLEQPTDSSNKELHDLSKLLIVVVKKVGGEAQVRIGDISDVNTGDIGIIQTVSRKALALIIFK